MQKFFKISEVSKLLKLIDQKNKNQQTTCLDFGKRNLEKLSPYLLTIEGIIMRGKLKLFV